MERDDHDQVQFTLRMREQLRQRLEDQARRRKISLNTAIVERLEQSLSAEDVIPVRLPSSLRTQLAADAARHGVPIDEEVTLRLLDIVARERSRLPGDEQTQAATDLIARTLRTLEELTGRKAFGSDGDPWLHEQSWKAVNLWFIATRPPGETIAPHAPLNDPYQRRVTWIAPEEMAETVMKHNIDNFDGSDELLLHNPITFSIDCGQGSGIALLRALLDVIKLHGARITMPDKGETETNIGDLDAVGETPQSQSEKRGHIRQRGAQSSEIKNITRETK